MKIHHLALYCSDIEAMRSFFMEFFAASSNEGYHNPHTGLRTYFLSFPDGECCLEIMTRPGMSPAAEGNYPLGYAHMSFSVGSIEKVDNISKLLSNKGYVILDGPRRTGDGFYESAVRGPEGIYIEITE